LSLVHLEDLSFCFFLFIDLRFEQPLLFSRLRKSFLNNGDDFFLCYLGKPSDYSSFPIYNLGNSLSPFLSFVCGKSFFFNFLFFKDSFPFKLVNYHYFPFSSVNFFIGPYVLHRKDFIFFMNSLFFYFSKNDRFFDFSSFFNVNIVSDSLGFITAAECGLVPGVNSSPFFKK